MIFSKRKITITGDKASIDKQVVLYRGDREIEIQFEIVYEVIKYRTSNTIEDVNASFGQLVIQNNSAPTPIVTDISPTSEGVVIFKFTKEMIDEISELGEYSFQIRLFDDTQTSRITTPIIENGIMIKEPLSIYEGDSKGGSAEVGLALAGTAKAQQEEYLAPFDELGNYNETTWATGDIITSGKLNKLEDGITGVNQKVKGITVPTKTSELNNDSNYATETFVTNKIAEASVGGGTSIDDTTIATNKTWSSSKIDSQIKDIVNNKIDDITLSNNALTLLANNNTIKTITLPTSSTGTGGSGRTLVVDYTHNLNTVIQPISLDLATGIYTTESIIEVADETPVCWAYNDKLDASPMYLPYEFFDLNVPTTWIIYKLKKISDTTFKLINTDGADFVYTSDKNTSVNVSKFHFETNSGSSLAFDGIELDGDFEIVCEGQSVSNNYSFVLNGYKYQNVNYIWSNVNYFLNGGQGPILVAGESFANFAKRHRYHEKIIYKATRKDDLISIDGICIMNCLVKYDNKWNTNAGIYYNNAYAKQTGDTSVINKIQMMNNNFGYLLLNGYNIRIYKV